MPELTNDQFGDLAQQFAEIQVDSMDTKTMMEWITDELIYQYGKLSPDELKERVDCYDSELYDELVDNVSNDTLVDPKEYSWGKETVNWLSPVENYFSTIPLDFMGQFANWSFLFHIVTNPQIVNPSDV